MIEPMEQDRNSLPPGLGAKARVERFRAERDAGGGRDGGKSPARSRDRAVKTMAKRGSGESQA